MSTRLKKLFISVLIITISSQIYIDVLVGDFRVTGAMVAFGIIMYFHRELHPLLLGLIVSMSTYLLRVSSFMLLRGFQTDILDGFAPEIIFYLMYSGVFWYLSKKNTVKSIPKYFLILMFSDLAANVTEIIMHYVLFDNTMTPHVLIILPIVAITRGVLACLTIRGFQYYQMLALVEEHEDRYNKLVWLSMNLKSEVYWMAKNMDKIEETMAHAYGLFENINNNHKPETWANHSVELASHVHEIKKDYELIMRGVTEITEFRFQDKGMWFSNVITLIKNKMIAEVAQKGYRIDIEVALGQDFYTGKHYQLMSIFRNLFMNAIEAIGDKEGENYIRFVHNEVDDSHVFKISDSGSGISQEDINEIFTPGFSTKINYETGAINRGLGLSFVKDMIEKTLRGTIEVTSDQDRGSEFTIVIPKEELEV
ncbi:ATP-binding protein [Acidaminobacter sp. JC074]|uniref:sensor histidine kinase n=1 Tax=Acidaminobacter sp. JC074 TaxID=2530199 RepID=UPI001F0E8294|nr:ATP-binding protein [Acidaminobacter sp. JC074]MCH4889061.1 ATP-binding protein [Acidaminobacter sp. JC074]